MFTRARKAMTSLVVSFGLSAWFDEQKGEARSSVRRTAPTSFSPGRCGGGAAGRAVCGRASSDNLTCSAKGSLGERPRGFKSAAASAIL
jgi:hypothetical protein